MAFSSSITEKTVFGNKRFHWGTFTNGASDSGGNIDTGLKVCEGIVLQHTGVAAVSSAPAVNETLPVDGSAVTVVTTTAADGIWFAWGR